MENNLLTNNKNADIINSELPDCKDCIYFKKMYVPPLDMYNNIPKDGYVCTLFQEIEVMWLGTKDQGAEVGLCECFMPKEDLQNDDL